MTVDADAFHDALYRIVDSIIHERDAIERMEISVDRVEKSQALFRYTQDFAVLLCGNAAMSDTYGIAGDDDQATILHALEQRLKLLQPTFASLEGRDIGSLAAVIKEAFAVRAGDAPVLFARSPGRRLVKHREHLRNWEALEVEAYAEGLGISLSERRRIVSQHFGNMPWDTIAGWKDKAPKYTESGRLRRPVAIMRAKRRGERDRSLVTIAVWEDMVREAAKRWSAARRSEI